MAAILMILPYVYRLCIRLQYSVSFFFLGGANFPQNKHWRLTYHLCRSDHITDALVCLRWLRYACRSEFKLAILTFLRHNTSVRSITSMTCLVVELFVLLVLAVWLCRLSGCQQSPFANRHSPTGIPCCRSTNLERSAG